MVKGKKPVASSSRQATTPVYAQGVESSDQAISSVMVPSKLQQQTLNVFKDACTDSLNDSFQPTLQEVKEHLFKRDFLTAFGKPEYLRVYAARWSPSRALAYLQIFQDISPFVGQPTQISGRTTDVDANQRLSNILPYEKFFMRLTIGDRNFSQDVRPTLDDAPTNQSGTGSMDIDTEQPPNYTSEGSAPRYSYPPSYPGTAVASEASPKTDQYAMRLACLGGGAGAELVAAAAWLRLQSEIQHEDGDDTPYQDVVEPNSLEIHCIDLAKWDEVVRELEHHIITPPVLSKYASAAAQAANNSILPPKAMKVEVLQQNLLDADLDTLRPVFQGTDIVTIMFTLNELYSTSVSKTQRLLFELTVAMQPGTLLLVVDSPGSYSTVTINNAEKKYPMQWLLDHTLLEACKNTRILPRGDHWEKLISDESRWFRLPADLKYPIDLENMRYQIHLYRRLEVKTESD